MSALPLTAPPTDAAASLCALRRAFADARRPPARRHRDIAEALGVSEAALIAAHVGAWPASESPLRALRLRPDWPATVAALDSLGEVTALTRNASCVHEKVGRYRDVSVSGPEGRGVGLVLGEAIDLRVFYAAWAHGFAVQEATERGPQRSLQWFDAQGTAIHKVFLREDGDAAAYEALVERFAHDDQAPAALPAVPEPPAAADRPDAEVDVGAFHADWAALRDTHDFFGLLRRHRLSRTQALRLAPPDFARPVEAACTQELLSRAAQQGTSVMVFVGNPGMIQIHTGPVRRVAVMGPWLNVLDPGFNLHLREDHIDRAWVVHKPTVDGVVSSLELFDAAGRTIAMLFGERKPGQAERCDWRELLASATGVASGAASGCAA